MLVQDVHSQNFSWFLRLRWAAIAGQAVLVLAGDRLFHSGLPWVPMATVLALEVGTNLACAAWARARPVPAWAVAAVMSLDIVLLTALLYLTGGDTHPMVVIFLANLALAGLLFRPRWTWMLLALALLCSGLLFLARLRAPAEVEADPLEWQLRELWISFGVAAALVVLVIQRTVGMLRERDQELQQARRDAERRNKLASLATLAAGAAHELASPLSTIAIAAKELARSLERTPGAHDALADAKLIREQVDRCRTILSQMAADAGEPAGERAEVLEVKALIQQALAELPPASGVEVEVSAENGRVLAPPRALSHAIRALVKNAVQASADGVPVRLRADSDPTKVRIEIRDAGSGMDPETLARAGEPFFTTKEPGRGMGLGLFLTRSLVEQLGGNLELVSTPGSGTRATVVLPNHAA